MLARSRLLFGSLAVCLLFSGSIFAQSTASIQGLVVDASGASLPNATVTVRNQATGEERATQTDAAGFYQVASLPVGTYRVEAKAAGMQAMVASGLALEVSRTVSQNFKLNVAAATETIEIRATAPVIEQDPVSVGSIVNSPPPGSIPTR